MSSPEGHSYDQLKEIVDKLDVKVIKQITGYVESTGLTLDEVLKSLPKPVDISTWNWESYHDKLNDEIIDDIKIIAEDKNVPIFENELYKGLDRIIESNVVNALAAYIHIYKNNELQKALNFVDRDIVIQNSTSAIPQSEVVFKEYKNYSFFNGYTHTLDLMPTTQKHIDRLSKYTELATKSGRIPHDAIAGLRLVLGYFLTEEKATNDDGKVTLDTNDIFSGVMISNVQKYRWKKFTDDKTIDIFPEFDDWNDTLMESLKDVSNLITEKTGIPTKTMITDPKYIKMRWIDDNDLGPNVDMEYVWEKIGKIYTNIIEKHSTSKGNVYFVYDQQDYTSLTSIVGDPQLNICDSFWNPREVHYLDI